MKIILESKQSVLVDPANNISAKLLMEILFFNMVDSGVAVNGRYYYEKVVNPETPEENVMKVELPSFLQKLPTKMVDELYASLEITYPAKNTWTQNRELEIELGARYFIETEQKYGLKSIDYIRKF